MEKKPMALKQFVANFFENQRCQGANLSLLTVAEIAAYEANPQGFHTRPEFMERLLADGEAVESICHRDLVTVQSSGKVVAFSDFTKTSTSRILRREGATSQKVADDRLSDSQAFAFEDEQIKGFIQQVDFKAGQAVVSGHFSLKLEDRFIRLRLSDGTMVTSFVAEGTQFTFKVIIPRRVDLSQTRYELV